jgi:hypothetical protein
VVLAWFNYPNSWLEARKPLFKIIVMNSHAKYLWCIYMLW